MPPINKFEEFEVDAACAEGDVIVQELHEVLERYTDTKMLRLAGMIALCNTMARRLVSYYPDNIREEMFQWLVDNFRHQLTIYEEAELGKRPSNL